MDIRITIYHRVAACMSLGMKRIPVWEVDVGDYSDGESSVPAPMTIFDRLYLEDKKTFIRCYSRLDGIRIPVADVARNARNPGSQLFGIKGTRHVAVIGDNEEVTLEQVTPRIEWSMFQ